VRFSPVIYDLIHPDGDHILTALVPAGRRSEFFNSILNFSNAARQRSTCATSPYLASDSERAVCAGNRRSMGSVAEQTMRSRRARLAICPLGCIGPKTAWEGAGGEEVSSRMRRLCAGLCRSASPGRDGANGSGAHRQLRLRPQTSRQSPLSSPPASRRLAERLALL
jgi:hypothetical protein